MWGRPLIPLPMGNFCGAEGSHQAWGAVKDVGKIFQVPGAGGRWGCSERFKPVSLWSRASSRGFKGNWMWKTVWAEGKDLGSLVHENCWRWVRERDLDAFLRWETKTRRSSSELSLQSLGLKRLFCPSGDLNKSGIDASANEGLLSRARRQNQTPNTTT